VWMAMGASYGIALPIELDEAVDVSALVARYGAGVVDRVNFARGRVRPSFSIDASAGVDVWRRDNRWLRVQCDVLNLTDRLNVINFASLFSGTALAAPRMGQLRVMTGW